MEKINFKNKRETGAIPINANNLNLMQDNVENSFKSSMTTSDKDTYNCNYINNQFNNLVKLKYFNVTTTNDGTFELLNINSNDLILFIAPIEIINGYCIPYKYYGTNKWYGIAYSYTGQIVTNTTFKIKVFYMEKMAV